MQRHTVVRDHDSQPVTECTFEQVSEGVIKCAACKVVRKTTEAPARYHRLCSARIPKSGPGTELKRLIEELHIRGPKDCNCERVRIRMDLLGVEWCRLHFDELREEIKGNASLLNWAELAVVVARAAVASLVNGIQIDPLDPIGSLLNEAIKRAEALEATGNR